jgi:hypothetical protein
VEVERRDESASAPVDGPEHLIAAEAEHARSGASCFFETLWASRASMQGGLLTQLFDADGAGFDSESDCESADCSCSAQPCTDSCRGEADEPTKQHPH